MGLFEDIYNTVARFFRPQETPEGEASKSVATNRLKLVLMQDRTNLTPRILEQMRSELIDLLSRYVELDKELLELNFEQEGDQVALMLSIPVIRAKDEEEIEAAIQAHKEQLKSLGDESEENDDESEEDLENEDSEEDITSEVTDEISDEDADSTEEEAEETEETEDSIEEEITDETQTVTKPSEMNSSKKAEPANDETEEVSSN